MCQPRRATGSLQTKYESRFYIKNLVRLFTLCWIYGQSLSAGHSLATCCCHIQAHKIVFSVLSLYFNCILLIPGCSEAVLVDVDITRSPPKCHIKKITRKCPLWSCWEVAPCIVKVSHLTLPVHFRLWIFGKSDLCSKCAGLNLTRNHIRLFSSPFTAIYIHALHWLEMQPIKYSKPQ